MSVDVASLKAFYDSPLGHMTVYAIGRCLQTLWSDLKNETVLGIGYPLPHLQPYVGHAGRLMVFMPAYQGVIAWPDETRPLTALVNEEELPLPDQSIDRILLVHSLEHARNIRPYLRELWRVLKGEGRMIVIVPNRRSLWAQLDSTPFGQGQPYTMTQLRHLLEDNMFVPTREERGLYMFPSSSRALMTSSSLMESLGGKIFRKVSGVVCIEAMKQVCAGASTHPRRRLPVMPKLAGI